MRILIDINHPAHVHLFKNVAIRFMKEGHQVLFTSRRKEISQILLENLKLPYKSLGRHYKSKLGKIWGIIKYDIKLIVAGLKFKPDIVISMGSIYATHAAFLLRKPSIMLQDTENAKFQNLLTYHFATVILNPSCYSLRINKKQLFYRGYHELAYLHPDEFTPDKKVLQKLGLLPDDNLIIMRFVSWNANHDKGHTGLSDKNKIKAVREFSKFGKVLITSEGKIPDVISDYKINIDPEQIHHVMAFSQLLYGESATMASECAVLGVPAIFLDNDGRGYTNDQEKYGLVFNFSESENDQEKSILKGIELLANYNQQEWQKRRQELLSSKINVTDMLHKFVLKFNTHAAIKNFIESNENQLIDFE